MKSPLAIMTVYSVASRLPSLRSALRGLDTTSVHGHLESWATARKPPAGALARKVVKTQTRYSWCPRNRGKSEPWPYGTLTRKVRPESFRDFAIFYGLTSSRPLSPGLPWRTPGTYA